MSEFVSSFVTGFKDVVEKDLPSRIPGIKIINVYDGLIHYSYNGNSRDLEKVIYFNNTFFVLKTYNDKNIKFETLVKSMEKANSYYLINKGSFRVRFNLENQFAKVDKSLTRRAEEIVLSKSKLKLDRLSPTSEIWYCIRREGFSFCGQLISKREFTEKNLNKGELRPEIAYLICCFSDIQQADCIAEPFCGYGSIPVQIVKKFNYSKLFISDIDPEKVELVSQKKQIALNEKVDIRVSDAFELNHITSNSVSLVITDPPWGYYEEIENIYDFYMKMISSFKRILTDKGRAIVLSARKEEFEKAVADSGGKILESLHTLVNGKKSSLYKIVFIN